MRFFMFLPLVALPSALFAQSAQYDGVVDRYGHNVLGDTPEWSQLCVDNNCTTLSEDQIFEDIEPRSADLDGDGDLEYITVISKLGEGASLAVFDHEANLIAQTPSIGTQNRWLAPVGVADFNQDGRMDIAYVQTPHIGGILKIWSYEDGDLIQTYELKGVSNHKIGDNFIRSDIRECENGPEILLPSADYSRILAFGFVEGAADPYIFAVDEYSEANWENRLNLPCPHSSESVS